MKATLQYEDQPFFYKLTIYIIGFLLFCEWLRPLEAVSNTDNVTVFFLYAAFCFFLSFLQLQWYLSAPLKLAGLVFIIDGLYMGERIFSSDWLTVLYNQILFNAQMIQLQEWWQITPLFRSLLFLILLWLMSYLLYYWFIVAKRMFIFIFMTITYVAILDTFTIYDGKWAMIRTFVLAMVALGMTSFAKEMDKEKVSGTWFKRVHLWALPLVGIILFSSVAAYASPKLDPQWPDPVPYLQSAAGGPGPGGSGVIQKVGYGEDDSRLGGSFIQDDTPVFRALASGDRYWRIESKDLYTGKGWEDTLAEPTRIAEPEDAGYETFTDEVQVEEQTAFVRMYRSANFNKLVYPYGLDSVGDVPENSRLRIHENTGEIDTLRGDSGVRFDEFAINYSYPSYEYGQLREAGTDDPQEIEERYLQLPNDLPARVRNLANQIVADEENRYDKVKAVESYFARNDFEYSTTDVPVPGRNEDYVDQFLFETQKGYCDNFSTSMVVLLRSAGIPARWVKGFTSGERIGSGESPVTGDLQNEYLVTSANAHSWVEAYFPGIGWVPFEPTQGFSNMADFYTEVETDTEDSELATTDTPVEDPLQGNPQQMLDEEVSNPSTGSSVSEGSPWLMILIGASLVFGTILYFTRFRWLSAFFIRKYRKEQTKDSYEKAYHYLLRVLQHKGMKRSPEQTLREYAKHVDKHFQTSDMRQLTYHYERMLYRNEQQDPQWHKVTELWENLIKKALS